VAVAEALGGCRTLVISTDPAPSLGDVFKRALAGDPTTIPVRRGLLHAVEIDARTALDRWIAVRRERLERIALRGTWLDQDDVSRLLRLSLPGIDELAGLLEITRFAETGQYDLIVIDTAPTGHTLRMLAMPDTLRAVARVFDEMQSKHRVMVEALRGGWTRDAEDALIEEIDRDARQLRGLLRDGARVQISWVTLPEPMAVEETADAAAALTVEGIPLAGVIVNRLTPKRERPCGWCDRHRAIERVAFAALHKRLPGTALTAVGARASEPIGTRALGGIGSEVEAAVPPPTARVAMPKGRWRATVGWRDTADVVSTVTPDGTRVVLFGGKGGVGKTTCAAAASIAIARRAAHRRVLLVSTDPAHSLADAFGSSLSDTPARVPGTPENLRVREMDAASGFRTVRAHYAQSIDALFDRLSRGSGSIGLDAGHDRRVMQGLIDLAPPGIDELAAVIEVTDAIESDPGEIVIMDTAPSGHALRLLEMPALVQDWTKALMSLVLKYQPIAGIGEFGAILLKLSQGLGRLRTLLADADRAAFIVVTRGASLPRAETTRLVARLREMRIHVPATVINAVGRGTCAACRGEAKAEQREISELRRQLPDGMKIVVAPSELPPPHGAAALRGWQAQWRM
jgi:arsenite-transporting ATPase